MDAEGVQLWLVNPDPDWPITPPKPDGEGWIWTTSTCDLLHRFHEYADIEIAAPGAGHLPNVRQVLLQYGRRSGLPWPCGRIPGHAGYFRGYNIEARGGAWVRRVEGVAEPELSSDHAPEEKSG